MGIRQRKVVNPGARFANGKSGSRSTLKISCQHAR